jgi:hypothetical protein
MSILAYAALTTPRIKGEAGTGVGNLPPGVKTYVDALALWCPRKCWPCTR